MDVLGWTGGLVLGFASRTRSASAGAGNPAYADLLLMGFGGYLVGAIVAELHPLAGPDAGPHGVDHAAAPRSVRDGEGAVEAPTLAMGGALAVVTELTFVRSSLGSRGFGFVALVVWAIVERAQSGRASSASGCPRISSGDDASRAVSVQSLALGGAGLISVPDGVGGARRGQIVVGAGVSRLHVWALHPRRRARVGRDAWFGRSGGLKSRAYGRDVAGRPRVPGAGVRAAASADHEHGHDRNPCSRRAASDDSPAGLTLVWPRAR